MLRRMRGAPGGALAGFIAPQTTSFGLRALFGTLPARFRLAPDRFGLRPTGLRWTHFDLRFDSVELTTKIHPPVLVVSFVGEVVTRGFSCSTRAGFDFRRATIRLKGSQARPGKMAFRPPNLPSLNQNRSWLRRLFKKGPGG